MSYKDKEEIFISDRDGMLDRMNKDLASWSAEDKAGLAAIIGSSEPTNQSAKPIKTDDSQSDETIGDKMNRSKRWRINYPLKSPVKKRVMKKQVNRFLKYIRNPANEFGFQVMSLHSKFYNLPVSVFLDDDGLWINLGAKRVVLFQANKDKGVYFDNVLPMTIEDNPQILGNKDILTLIEDELGEIKDFVRNHQKAIIQLGNDKIDKEDFFKIIEPYRKDESNKNEVME
jgi:hypothetical protein